MKQRAVSIARMIKNDTSEKPELLHKLHLFLLLVINVVPIFTESNERPLLKLFTFCCKDII